MASVSRTEPPEPAKQQRYPLQFNLRTLLTAVLVAGAFFGGRSVGEHSSSQHRDPALLEAKMLVAILQKQNRYAETIPFLRHIVKTHPECLTSRILLMRAYLRAGNHQQLRILRQETNSRLRQKGILDQDAVRTLAPFWLEFEPDASIGRQL